MSKAVNGKLMFALWGTVPILVASSFRVRVWLSTSSIITVPVHGIRERFRHLSRVVFPDPLGPRIPMMSPSLASSSMLDIASVLP